MGNSNSSGASSLGSEWQKLRRECRANMAPICWLCGGYIDRELKFPHPYSWSLDHKKSLARGGEKYALENLAPAHLRCNSIKGAREQRKPNTKTRFDW